MKKCTQIFSLVVIASLVSSVAWTMEEDESVTEQVENDGEDGNHEFTVKPLSQSVIAQSCDGTQKAYDESTLLMKSDLSKPRIHFLVAENNHCNWEALVNRGYQQQGFTELDVQWVVNEVSEPYHLSKERANLLFKLMITMQFGGHYEQKIIDLLMSPKIPVADGMLNLYTSRTRKTMGSVITNAIEMARRSEHYLEALKSILALLPIADINTRIIISREEYNAEKTISRFNPQYDATSYNLLGWLMRKKKHYIDAQQKRYAHYVGAAILLMDRNFANKIEEGEKDLESNLFAMITLLNKQGDVDEDKLQMAARRLK